MYSVSSSFHENIKDVTIPQEFLCIMGTDYFTTRDGDFTDDDIVISQVLCEGDIRYGNAPSSVLSFCLNNEKENLGSITWGEAKTYIGVQMDTEEYVFGDGVNCHIEINGDTWEGKEGGVYKNGLRYFQYPAPCTSLQVFDGYLYAGGEGTCRRLKLDDSTYSDFEPDGFMARKWMTGVSTVFDGSDGYVWTGLIKETYEYCPMGIFQIDKPKRVGGEIIEIEDAYDRMTLFDRDAGPWYETLTDGMTLGELFESLCNYVGVEYVSSTFKNSTVTMETSSMVQTAHTCRDILAFIAERAIRNVRINRLGQVEIFNWGTTSVEDLNMDTTEFNGTDISEYRTQPITRVTLKSSEGSSLSEGTAGNEYIIYGNPLFAQLLPAHANDIKLLPTYVPIIASVLIADPSIDVGDMVTLEPEVAEYVLSDAYDRVYSTENFILTTGVSATSFPIMRKELRWNVGCEAEYEASGEEYREVDDMTRYNATVNYVGAVDNMLTQTDIFNRLTNNGQMQGLYMSGNDLYINASYIQSGYISSDVINAGTITISQLTNAAQDALITATTVKNQYYLSTSASSATGGSWSDTVPTWAGGKYIWTRVATTKTYASGTSSTTYSTGVYDANLTESLANAPIVNMLPAVYYRENESGKVYESNDITWTLNSDGSVTATGTATATSTYSLTSSGDTAAVPRLFIDPSRKYTLSGCPPTGSSSTYRLIVRTFDANDSYNTYSDYGSGVTTATGCVKAYVYITIYAGYACPTGGLTFYPMLEVGDKAHAYVSSHTGASATAANSIKTTVSVYYRSTTSSTPTIDASTTIGTADNTDNAWEYVLPKPKKSAYFFTCERYTYADGTISFSTVRQMSNLTASSLWCHANDATLIDGADIYTGSVTADQISVNELSACVATVGGFKIETTSIHTNGVAITSNAANSIGLSSADFTRTINSTQHTDLRFAIGSNFGVSNSGALYASSGTIGKYTITGTYLSTGSGSTMTGMGGNQAFWAGSSSSDSAPFRVSYAGALVSTSATIGGWTVDSTHIQKSASITENSVTVTYKPSLQAPTTPTASNRAFYIARTEGSSTTYPFAVFYDGRLTATKATITGSITASSLTLSDGVTIAGTKIDGAVASALTSSACSGNASTSTTLNSSGYLSLAHVNSGSKNATSSSNTFKIGNATVYTDGSNYIRFDISNGTQSASFRLITSALSVPGNTNYKYNFAVSCSGGEIVLGHNPSTNAVGLFYVA